MNELKNAQPIPIYAGGSLAGPAVSDDKPPSALASLSGIFFDPVRTFESFRQQPRFLLAAFLIALALSFSTALIYQRLGVDNIIRAQLERSSTSITPEQKEKIIEMQAGPAMRTIGVVSPLVSLTVVFAGGAALYLLGVLVIGGSIGYRQTLSVWIYSALPPAFLAAAGNIVVLFLKSPNDIDLTRAGGGLVHANLGFFVDAAAHPVLTTAVGLIDLFAIYGLVLAIIGLHKVARISPARASAIAGSIWLMGGLIRIGMSAVSNAAIG
jgi:hypothetical protein